MVLKKFLRSQAYESRLAGLLASRAARLGTPVFMFHHTMPAGSECFDEGMDTEAELFDGFVGWLQQHYRVVPLTEIVDRLDAAQPLDGYAAITIDDGWWDTYEHAFPIMRRHGVTATVYLPLDYIGSDRQLWQDAYWDVYRQLVERGAWDELNRAAEARFAWWPREPRRQTYDGVLDALGYRRITEANEVIAFALETFGLRLRLRPRSFMTWEQVHEMRAAGFSFGSHTNSHLLLTRVSPDEARDEIVSSKRRLEEILGAPAETFCYPAGRHDAAIADAVRDAGYRAAVTDRPRLITRRDSLWTLPRVGVSSLSLRGQAGFSANAINFQLARCAVRAQLPGFR